MWGAAGQSWAGGRTMSESERMQGTDTKGKASGWESRAFFKLKSKNQGGNVSRLENLSRS